MFLPLTNQPEIFADFVFRIRKHCVIRVPTLHDNVHGLLKGFDFGGIHLGESGSKRERRHLANKINRQEDASVNGVLCVCVYHVISFFVI